MPESQCVVQVCGPGSPARATEVPGPHTHAWWYPSPTAPSPNPSLTALPHTPPPHPSPTPLLLLQSCSLNETGSSLLDFFQRLVHSHVIRIGGK